MMKTRNPLVLILVLATLFAGFAPRTSTAAVAVSFDFFYDSLDSYGQWIEVPEYGYCWHPSGVDQDWAPYSDGYWAYTDAGWTWVSYEDWGGITYHYGRWVRLNDQGWCWVPGTEWGPAWVSWRSSDDYIGWAPLPPEVVFNRDAGISVDVTYGIGPGYYNFCRYRDFGSPAIRPCIVPRSQNLVIINNTVNITNITMNPQRNIVFNGGPNFQMVQGRSGRPIQTLRLVQQTNWGGGQSGRNALLSKQHGNQLEVVAPVIQPSGAGERVRPKNIAATVPAANVDRGWNHVSEAQMRQLKYQPQAGNKADERAHARPVTESELRVVTEKAGEPTPAALSPQHQPSQGRSGRPVATPVPSVSKPAVSPESVMTPVPSFTPKSHRTGKQTESSTPSPISEGSRSSGRGVSQETTRSRPAEVARPQPTSAPRSPEASRPSASENVRSRAAAPQPEVVHPQQAPQATAAPREGRPGRPSTSGTASPASGR